MTEIYAIMFITYRLTGGYQPSSRGNKLRSMKIMSGNFAMLLIVIKVTGWPDFNLHSNLSFFIIVFIIFLR